MDPLDYATQRRSPSGWGVAFFVLGCLLTAAAMWVVLDVFWEAIQIHYAGRFHARVSFYRGLSLKAYHVQAQGLFVLPIAAIAFLTPTIHSNLRPVTLRLIVLSAASLAAMIAMDCIW